jgi:hypothetical protein
MLSYQKLAPDKDEAALVMHSVCDFSPSLYLFLGIDAWEMKVASEMRTDPGTEARWA